ncbi:MAG: hypothetical protein AAFO82_01000 [Bacteroidota bacterium]
MDKRLAESLNSDALDSHLFNCKKILDQSTQNKLQFVNVDDQIITIHKRVGLIKIEL